MTNADRIRSMSDNDLAKLLEGKYGNMLPNTAMKWLKEPYKDIDEPAERQYKPKDKIQF